MSQSARQQDGFSSHQDEGTPQSLRWRIHYNRTSEKTSKPPHSQPVEELIS